MPEPFRKFFVERQSPRELESDSSLPSLRRTRRHSLAVSNVSCSKQSSCSFDNIDTFVIDSKRPKNLPHSCLAPASVRPQRARRRPQEKAARGGRFYNMHQRWICVALPLLLLLPVACVGQQDQSDNDSIPWHCGCQTCTQSIWERQAGNSTCGALIRQATTPDLSRERACTRIATEFAECAPCSNLGCDAPAPRFCACWQCGAALAKEEEQDATDAFVAEDDNDSITITCGDKIEEMLWNNPLLTEFDACSNVADILPTSCGKFCKPTACQQSSEASSNTSTTTDKKDRVVGWVFAGGIIAILLILLIVVIRYKKKPPRDPETAPSAPSTIV